MTIYKGDTKEVKGKIAIVVSRFNEIITESLLAGAFQCLEDNGFDKESTDVFRVPGAYEIPFTVKLALDRKYDGVLALGCVVKGETAHFEYICEPLSHKLMDLSCEYSIPVGFGVLTCYTAEQAFARAQMPPDSHGNKGYESAEALLEMMSLNK